jgi:protocatechuate 3,4-dioxygenase beta subunit
MAESEQDPRIDPQPAGGVAVNMKKVVIGLYSPPGKPEFDKELTDVYETCQWPSSLLSSRITMFAKFFLTLILSQAAQPQQAPSGASIEGTVVEFGSGRPIAGAILELRRTQAAPAGRLVVSPSGEVLQGGPLTPATFTTGSEGKFTFKDPAPGEYRLYATRIRGHVPTEFGQRTPTGTGTPFTIAAGQKMSSVTLRMAPVSSISGRIVDEAGDPVPYAAVDVLRSGYQDGKRRLIPGLGVRTDDRGAYRLFNLPPGEYYVAVRPWDARSTRGFPASESTGMPNRFASREVAGNPLLSRRVNESGEIVEETWMPVYYPGTPDVRAARVLSVRMGEDIAGIDISLALSPAPARRVTGTVIDGTTGTPLAGALVRLTPREQLTPSVIMPMATTDQKGTFDVPGVLPTSYSLFVSGATPPPPGTVPPAGPIPITYGELSGYVSVDASSGDVRNLQIVAVKGLDIPVRVTIDDGAGIAPLPPLPPGGVQRFVAFDSQGNPISINATPPSTSRRITLIRDPGTGSPTGTFVITAGWPGIPSNTVSPQIDSAAAGGFVLRNVSLGEYRVNVAGLTQGSYVKSIRRGQTDVMRDGLRLLGAANPSDPPLDITIGANAGVLPGRVVNDAGAPMPNVTVVLVPSFQYRSRLDLYQSASTDINGTFRFQGIVPDEYKLFSWEEVTTGAWHDADFLRPVESRGLAVTVGNGANPPQDVKVIPWSGR